MLYVSLHGDLSRAYPYYSGYAREVGFGAGEGMNINLPLPPRTEGDAYLAALDVGLAICDHDPDAPLVLSLGFDTFERDPIADLALTTDDYARIGAATGSARAAGNAPRRATPWTPSVRTRSASWAASGPIADDVRRARQLPRARSPATGSKRSSVAAGWASCTAPSTSARGGRSR